MTVKDFDKAYKERGAYHVHARGFDAWFLEDNYSKIAAFCDEGHTVLDIGCGEGRLSDFLKSHKLDGVDFLQSALDLNRNIYGQKYRRLIKAHLRDLGSLGLPDGYYDRIVCSLTLMYLTPDELIQCLTSAWRLLKDNGLFVATYPNSTPLRAPNSDSFELSVGELQLAFQEAGFQPQTPIPVCPYLPKEIVKASYDEGSTAAARENYLVARAQMDMTNSYHFLITARKAGS